METKRRYGTPSCEHPGCSERHLAGGFCRLHYERSRDGLDMDAPKKTEMVGIWGKWSVEKDGYVTRKRRMVRGGKQEKQYQHRVVMESEIGRELRKDESVHHRDGDRANNHISNLELWSRYQPSGQRVEDKISAYKVFLESYGYTVEAPLM